MVNRALSGFATVVAKLSQWGAILAAVALVLMTVLIGVEVAGRALFGISTMVADEMSGYLNCAVVFLGLSYSLREGGFIRVEVVYNRMKGTLKQLTRWLIGLTSLAYMGIVVIYMARHVRFSYERGIVSTQVSETPLYLPQSLILVGAVIMALQLLSYLLNRVRDLP